MGALILGANVDYHNGGLAQVGTFSDVPYQEQPFIDRMKSVTSPWIPPTGVTSSEDVNYLYDSRGYPTKMFAAGVGTPQWASGGETWIVGSPTTGNWANIWVLDWPGIAVLTLTYLQGGGGVLTLTSSSSNRKEYTFSGTPPGLSRVTVRITSMDDNAFSGGQIRLYPKAYESLLDSGDIFDPSFLERMRPIGVHRHLNWYGVQTNRYTCPFYSDTTPIDYTSWFSYHMDSTRYCGVATKVDNNYAVIQPSSSFSSWTDGQIVQFIMDSPTFVTPSAATNAAICEFTTGAAHGLTAGDKIEFSPRTLTTPQAAWNKLFNPPASVFGPVTWTVTVTGATTFTIPFDSSTASAYPANIQYYRQMTLQVGVLAAKACSTFNGIQNFGGSSNWLATSTAFGVYDQKYDRVLVGETNLGYSLLNCGVPIEVVVRLSNECGAHPWVCLPPPFKDSFVTNLATYLRDNLLPGLVPRIEWGNEPWNAGYSVFRYAGAYGLVEPAFLSGPFARAGTQQEYYGYRTAQIQDLVNTVYLNSGKTAEVILELQAVGYANTLYTVEAMKCPAYSGYVTSSSPGNTSKYPTAKSPALAYAGYFAPPFYTRANAQTYPGYTTAIQSWLTATSSGKEAAYTFWYNSMRFDSIASSNFPTVAAIPSLDFLTTASSGTGKQWMANAAAALPNPVKVYHYEGGNHLPSVATITNNWSSGTAGCTTIDVYNCFTDYMQNSSLWGQMTEEYYDKHISIGIQWPSNLLIGGVWSSGGAFWMLYNLGDMINPTPSQGYLGFLRGNAP